MTILKVIENIGDGTISTVGSFLGAFVRGGATIPFFFLPPSFVRPYGTPNLQLGPHCRIPFHFLSHTDRNASSFFAVFDVVPQRIFEGSNVKCLRSHNLNNRSFVTMSLVMLTIIGASLLGTFIET